MQYLGRDALAHARILRSLGPSATFDALCEGWPIFDSLMAAVLYRDGKPQFITSVLAKALDHDSRIDRLDRIVLPKADLMSWGAGIFDDDLPSTSYRLGRWQAVWLGEVDFPVESESLGEREYGLLPTANLDRIMFSWAMAQAAINANTRWLIVGDNCGPIDMAFELSEMLGYDPSDHRWVPERWRHDKVDPGISCGFETVPTGEGGDALLRYYSYRIKNASVYLPRIWHHGQRDMDQLEIQVPVSSLS